jgi:CRP-like cAMP-binding protein
MDEPPDTEPPLEAVAIRSPVSIRVLSAAESHAGMLDPWSEGEVKTPEAPGAQTPPSFRSSGDARVSTIEEPEDEVVTSALPVATAVQLRTAKPTAVVTPRPQPKPAPPRPVARPPALPGASPEPLASSSRTPRASKLPSGDARATRVRILPPALPPVAESGPPSAGLSTPATEREVIPAGAAVISTAPAAGESSLDPLDLSGIEAFADLPDDARDALARAASLRRYAKGEAIEAFALAFVVSGEIEVRASEVPIVATTLGAGGVLRARGTLEEPIPLRLACASNAVVATWDGDAMQSGLGPCPWVEDDLRSSADRVQALAGSTLGALGQRLSVELRTSIVDRLAIRVFAEHEAVVTEGVSVPGLILIGAGRVMLVSDDTPPTQVGAGQFVLTAEAMSAGASPATVRAAHGGALVLVGDRKTTQELFATEPLLLEIFAGW